MGTSQASHTITDRLSPSGNRAASPRKPSCTHLPSSLHLGFPEHPHLGFRISCQESPLSICCGCIRCPQLRYPSHVQGLGLTPPRHARVCTRSQPQTRVPARPGLVLIGTFPKVSDKKTQLSRHRANRGLPCLLNGEPKVGLLQVRLGPGALRNSVSPRVSCLPSRVSVSTRRYLASPGITCSKPRRGRATQAPA